MLSPPPSSKPVLIYLSLKLLCFLLFQQCLPLRSCVTLTQISVTCLRRVRVKTEWSKASSSKCVSLLFKQSLHIVGASKHQNKSGSATVSSRNYFTLTLLAGMITTFSVLGQNMLVRVIYRNLLKTQPMLQYLV